MSESLRVVIYARVSTKDKGQDTENQLLDLRQFCAQSGWTVVHEYVDHESAKTGDRTQFKKLTEDATRRKFGAVICWALDRFVREGIEATFAYLRNLKNNGVDFISYTEPYFRTQGAVGELLLAIAAWIAERERERISERVRAGMRRVKTTGVTKSGKAVGRPVLVIDRQAIWERHTAGASYKILQEEFKISRGTAQRIIARLKPVA